MLIQQQAVHRTLFQQQVERRTLIQQQVVRRTLIHKQDLELDSHNQQHLKRPDPDSLGKTGMIRRKLQQYLVHSQPAEDTLVEPVAVLQFGRRLMQEELLDYSRHQQP
ncbi:hypothetical protein LINGRAHAP2_LOCUS36232 [Linum grandiflorum]